MSKAIANFKYQMPTDRDYTAMSVVAKLMDKPEMWEIEEYNKENRTITIKETFSDPIQLIFLIENIEVRIRQCEEVLNRKGKDGSQFHDVSYKLEGHLEYVSSGEQLDILFERENGKVYAQDTDIYWAYGSGFFSSYDELVEAVDELFDIESQLSEDEFCEDDEYAFNNEKIYVNELPPYYKKWTLKQYKEHWGFNE